MANISYSAVATRPEEIVSCTALDAGDYPERYAEKVKVIVDSITDISLKEKVKQTLGLFEKGSAGNLVQSSPYRLVVLQEFLPKGKVLASMPRLRIAKENDQNFMRGFYVDGGLNLVPYNKGNEAINAIQAGKLEADLRKVGIKRENARLIPYNVLTLEFDGKSSSGLVFRLLEEGKDIAKQAILNTKDFKWNYSPNQGGLFRAYLDGDSNGYCGNRNLDSSNWIGGVVVESALGTSQKNLQAYKNKLLKENAEKEAQLDARFNDAKQILADAYVKAEKALSQ